MEPLSFQGDVIRLCGLILDARQSHERLVNRPQLLRRLKKTAYDALFRELHFPFSTKPDVKTANGFDSCWQNKVVAHSLTLRLRRRLDDAARLEHLMTQLQSVSNKETISSVMTLLTCLIDAGPPEKQPVIGHGTVQLPKVYYSKDLSCDVRDGPWVYGESAIVRADDHTYMHFPRHIFEIGGISMNEQGDAKKDILNIKVFQQPPGAGLGLRNIFSMKGLLEDTHEMENKRTLFKALVRGRTDNIDVKLELPDFPPPENISKFEIKVPRLDELMDVRTGFNHKKAFVGEMDVSPADSSGVFSLDASSDEDDMWEEALKCDAPRRYSWGARGRAILEPRPRYLTEAGGQALEEVYRAWLHNLSLLDHTLILPQLHRVPQRHLVADILNLLLAVPSHSFSLLQDKQQFTMRPGLYITGLTPESVAALCRQYLDCGAAYHQLGELAQPPVLDSFYNKGLIFQAFCAGVRRYLQYYRACVLSVSQDKTLLELQAVLAQLTQQLLYVADLCGCSARGHTLPPQYGGTLPTGVPLLSYLYEEAVKAEGATRLPVLLSLLQASCKPYLLLVEDWIFHGHCGDAYSEFMVTAQDHFLQFRDRYYWTHGYVLSDREAVPLFLQDLANSIFVCGKSINLLRLCQPQHFLFSKSFDIPRIVITYSGEELHSLDTRCQTYLGQAQAVAKQQTVSRQQAAEREEQVRRELMVRARQTRAQESRRLQVRIEELRRKRQQKKKKELDELKKQMEEDLQRRSREKSEEKKADKEWREGLTRQELLEAHVEEELEKRAREELIEEYARLTADAARRELRALWRVERLKLDASRRAHLLGEEAGLVEELRNHPLPVQQDAVVMAVRPQWETAAGVTIAVEEPSEPPGRPKWEIPTGSPSRPQWEIPGGSPGQLASGQLPLWAKKDSPQHPSVEGGSESEDLPTRDDQPVFVSPVRTSVKMSGMVHTSMESERETSSKPSIHLVEGAAITAESEEPDAKLHTRQVAGAHISQQTQPEAPRPQVRSHQGMHATTETESVLEPSHVRTFSDKHASRESQDTSDQFVPKLKVNMDHHPSKESEYVEIQVKKRSIYGHASEMSKETSDTIPKLKQVAGRHAALQSISKDFGIAPKRRTVQGKSVDQESSAEQVHRPVIQVGKHGHASVESVPVDLDQRRLERFRSRNVHGHASASSVQTLLYGETYREKPGSRVIPEKEEFEPVGNSYQLWSDTHLQPFQDDWQVLNEPPTADLLATSSHLPQPDSQEPDADAHHYMALPALLRRCVITPIQAQAALVNQSLLDYFFVELDIQSHFTALRRYMFMEDGEFGQMMSDLLFDRIATKLDPWEVYNPVFLNEILQKALCSSVHRNSATAGNLSFELRYFPQALEQNSASALDCLDISYKVEWPLTLVITEDQLTQYRQVFTFLLQLKWAVWALQDTWHRLKRYAVIHKAGSSGQFKQLHLIKHEMEHFVHFMQGYVANQLIEVTWQEFQQDLKQQVHCLDDLHDRHTKYIKMCTFRCLLTKRQNQVMQIIQNILSLILTFRMQLVSQSWQTDPTTGEATHPAFQRIMETYTSFHNYSHFLYKVVRKMAMRGYQPHLRELLLRLNFNNYYQADS